jgi:uncharacterized protein YqfA (UPF0365 family)
MTKPGPPKIITFPQRVSLWILRVRASPIIEARRRLLEAGQDVSIAELCAHRLADGEVREVADALIEARRLGVPLAFERACALDLLRDREVPAQRPAQLVRAASEARELFLEKSGPMEIAAPGKFTWRPRLRARLKLDLARYLGGADEDLIEMRLKLTLRTLYNQAATAPAADQALAAWLADAKQLSVLDEGARYSLLSIKRVL